MGRDMVAGRQQAILPLVIAHISYLRGAARSESYRHISRRIPDHHIETREERCT